MALQLLLVLLETLHFTQVTTRATPSFLVNLDNPCCMVCSSGGWCILCSPATSSSSPLIELTSDPTSLEGTLCPTNVTVNCMVRDVENLRWFFDHASRSEEYTYAFSPGDTFPHSPTTVTRSLAGVEVVITNAVQDADNPDAFDASSTLTTNLTVLRDLGIQRIQCGSGDINIRSLINVNFTIQSHPDSPSFSCSLLSSPGGPEVTLQWSPSITFVERYRVAVNPDPSSCSSQQVNASEDYSCSGLSLGTKYSITVSAINCGDQVGTRNIFTVLPQVPNSPTDIRVFPTYNEIGELQDLEVQWTYQPLSSRGYVTETFLSYTVVLETNAEKRGGQKVVNSDSCSDICSASFSSIPSNMSYQAIVTASGVFGQSSSSPSDLIDGSIEHLFNLSLSFESCVTSANCSSSSSSEGECVVQYGQDPTYQEQGLPISGPFNSPFSLPLMEASTLYYSTFMLTVNSTRIQVNKNFMTGEFSSRLTIVNTVLLSVGIAVFIIDVVIISLLMVAIFCTQIFKLKKDHRSYFSSMLVSIFVVVIHLLISFILWVATGIVIIKQSDTCDPTWQTSRDALIISAFIFSLTDLLPVFVTLLTLIRLFHVHKTDYTNEIELAPVPPLRTSLHDNPPCVCCGEDSLRTCNACGKAVCHWCLGKKAYLAYNKREKEVCEICYEKFLKEKKEKENQFGALPPRRNPMKDATKCGCNGCDKLFTYVPQKFSLDTKCPCLACGKIVCRDCLENKAYLAYIGTEEKVCKNCHEKYMEYRHEQKEKGAFGIFPPLSQELTKSCNICKRVTCYKIICKGCGKNVCAECLGDEAYLAYLKKQERVCTECHVKYLEYREKRKKKRNKIGEFPPTKIEAETCHKCGNEVGKKFCNACEKVTCENCIKQEVYLPYMGKEAGVCEKCFEEYQKQYYNLSPKEGDKINSSQPSKLEPSTGITIGDTISKIPTL